MKKFALSALAVVLCLSMVACGTWETQAISIVKVLTPGAIAILEVTSADSGHPISPVNVATINNDFGNVQTLLTDLSSVNAPPGTLTKLQVALQLAKKDIIPILELARISNVRHVAEINIMIDLVINEINAVISLSSPAPTLSRAKAKLPLSASQFHKQFDAQLARTGHAKLAVK